MLPSSMALWPTLITRASTKPSPPSLALCSTSPAPSISNSTSSLRAGVTESLSTSISSQSSSTTPYTPSSIVSLHPGSTSLLPHLFANTNPLLLTRLSSKGQSAHQFISPIPIHPFSNTQKWLSNAQLSCFRPSPVSLPTTPPFQQQSLDFSTCPPLDTLQLYHDERLLLKEPPSPITMDNSNDTSSPIHNSHSISPVTQLHDVYQHPACGLYQLPALLHLCSPKPFIKQ